MARRLDTVTKIMDALRPHAALWAFSGPLARAMAGTVERVSMEINSVIRDMETEFDRRVVPGEGVDEREDFTNLFRQASDAILGASMMALSVGGSMDKGLLNQDSAFEKAMDAARLLDDANERLLNLHQRHGLATAGGFNLSA